MPRKANAALPGLATASTATSRARGKRDLLAGFCSGHRKIIGTIGGISCPSLVRNSKAALCSL